MRTFTDTNWPDMAARAKCDCCGAPATEQWFCKMMPEGQLNLCDACDYLYNMMLLVFYRVPKRGQLLRRYRKNYSRKDLARNIGFADRSRRLQGVKCRCGEPAHAYESWCAIDNRWLPVCFHCSYECFAMTLTLFRIPKRDELMAAYRREYAPPTFHIGS